MIITFNGNTQILPPILEPILPIVRETNVGCGINTNNCGLIQNLMSNGCFGPFPTTQPIYFSSPAMQTGESLLGTDLNSGGSKRRKRKRTRTNPRTSSHLSYITPLPNFYTPLSDSLQNCQLDLNAKPMINPTAQSDTENSLPSNSDEVRKTVEIGAEIGFQ